jgi:hypothetical protein
LTVKRCLLLLAVVALVAGAWIAAMYAATAMLEMLT